MANLFGPESKLFGNQSRAEAGGQGAGDNYYGLRPGDIPEWSSRFEYDAGREVLAPDGNYYRCLIDHTASEIFNDDIANWELFGGSGLLLAIQTGQTYIPTNVTINREFDADSTSLDEIADIVGTLIKDLQSVNILS